MNVSREQLRAAYRALPEPIREYLLGETFGEEMKQFGARHGLHIDTIGAFAQATGYLLSGLMNPAQFQQELRGMGISDSEASDIITELNEKIFKPLQQAVRNSPVELTSEPAASAVAVPPIAFPAPQPPERQPRPAVPPPSISFGPPVAPPPVAPAVETPASTGNTPLPAAPLPPIKTEIPAAIRPVQPVTFNQTPPSAPVTLRPPETLMPAKSVPPPANLPGTYPEASVPVAPARFIRTMATDFGPDHQRAPAAQPVQVPPPVQKPASVPMPAAPRPKMNAPMPQAAPASPVANPLAGGYGVDPYREPME